MEVHHVMSASPPAPPKRPSTWIAYRIRGAKAVWLGQVEAVDRDAAIFVAAAEFGVPAVCVIVQRIGNNA
jgi:hypothetical protein